MSIRFDVDGQIVLITIDRPEAMNSLDPDHNQALGAAMRRFEDDPALRVAILTGAGDRSFSAGADLKLLIPSVREAAKSGESIDWNFGGFTRSTAFRKPKIAAINGHALAGGLEMALACDIRLASPNATLGLAETKWAIIPGAGGTVRLPRAIPMGIAMEMILTGDPIAADEAWRVGLVNRVVPLEELIPTALELARTIAARGPLAVEAARHSVLTSPGMDLDAAMDAEYQAFLGVLRTKDAVEGPRAFAEGRDPIYHGR